MDMLQLIRDARTCRRFVEQDPLALEDLRWLTDCAHLGPCARNAQVLRYALVHSAEGCAALFPHTHWAGILKDWGGPHPGERPTGYIAILAPQDSGKLQHIDAGIAAMSMQLAATTRGWGCCMHASFDAAKVAAILGTPEDMSIPLLLAFGRANETRTIAPMPADGSFNYWRDAAQVHYVPKRALDDVIIAVK